MSSIVQGLQGAGGASGSGASAVGSGVVRGVGAAGRAALPALQQTGGALAQNLGLSPLVSAVRSGVGPQQFVDPVSPGFVGPTQPFVGPLQPFQRGFFSGFADALAGMPGQQLTTSGNVGNALGELASTALEARGGNPIGALLRRTGQAQAPVTIPQDSGILNIGLRPSVGLSLPSGEGQDGALNVRNILQNVLRYYTGGIVGSGGAG